MKSSTEKRTLTSFLKRIDNPRGGVAGTRWFLPALWVGLVISTVVLLVLSRWVRVEILMFISFMLGLIYFHAYMRAAAVGAWPLLARYVDREAIERRLAELGA